METARNSVTSEADPSRRRKLLVVCAVDIMAWVLLREWLKRLRDVGFEVHIACSEGKYFHLLENEGFHMHRVHIQRNFNMVAHARAVAELVRIIRREKFTAMNTHSPVGAAIGRVAAALGRIPTIIYTVHGFYFHDQMAKAKRFVYCSLEWLLGRFTDAFMFVSDEDRMTAQRIGIAGTNARVTTIFNGVDLEIFSPRSSDDAAVREVRDLYGIPNRLVIGTVGRIVKEKGYREFLEMAEALTAEGVDATYLVVGDSLATDRDQFGPRFRQMVRDRGLSERFIFTGMTDRVAQCLSLMDIFVLASYREGFPRSVLEAMAMSLPVVATDIRGCREAVASGLSGFIVPPRDSHELAKAVGRLALDPHERRRMGAEGRRLVIERFDSVLVINRFTSFIQTELQRVPV